jgi:hypothetical protein
VATQVRRNTQQAVESVFAEHITLKRQGSVLTTRADALKSKLKDWFKSTASDDVYENEQGSKFYDFPETISDGKETYKGMELRRSVSAKFNEDEATKILQRKGVYNEALTPVLDQDKIYVLLQEGKITEKDIDKMFEETESFAFWPLKGEVL